MSLQELKEKAVRLSPNARLELLRAIAHSLQGTTSENDWQYLVARSHPWRRQLYVKGRKLLASTVWKDAIANNMMPEEAADNWNLPLAVIYEVFCYCEANQALIALEADEERCRLEKRGVSLEPMPID